MLKHKKNLEATQLDNKMNYLQKSKIDLGSLQKGHERFRSEKHSFFTEKSDSVTLSSNDYKIIQSIYSIETYA